MAERIATGEVYIEVNQREAEAALNRINAEHEKTMRDIDRREADVKIRAKLDDLKRDLKQAEKAVDDAAERMERASDARSKRLAAMQQKQAQANLKTIKDTIKGTEGAIKSRQRENAVLVASEARRVAIAKRDEQILAVEKKLEQQRDKAAEKERRLSERAARAKLREQTQAERASQRRQRELNEVPKLEAAYVRLYDKIERLNNAKRKARGDSTATFNIEVDERLAMAEIERIRSEIRRRTGADPISIPVKPELGRSAGERLRLEFYRQNGVLSAVAAAVGADLGSKMGRGISSGMRRTMDRGVGTTLKGVGASIGNSVARAGVSGVSRLGNALNSLSDAAIRLGPFTMSIRQALISMALFGPLLLDMAGAAGALVGSVGSATLGLGALTAAVAGGGIPVLLGMGIVIKQVAGEFKDVAKAQKAYDDAVQKGNTDLAAKKMKELKAVMGNVSEETVKMVGRWDDVQQAFGKGTSQARGSVWTMIAEGISTADTLMDTFTKNTNKGMKSVEKSTGRWMAALRSPRGERVLDEMMGNFATAMEPALDGLGSLLGYLGRVGAIASRSLNPMAKTFKDWAKNLNSVDDGTLTKKVDGTINSLKTLGRFLMAGGRLLKTFFGQGVESGNTMLTDMTNKLNEWNKALQTGGGAGDFFKESVAGAQTLYGFIAPLASGFLSWAQAIAPVARGFGEVLTVLSEIIGALGKIAGMSGILTGLGVTLGTIWAAGKIRAATGAVAGFAAALTGASRASKGLAATNVAATLAASAAAARVGGTTARRMPKGMSPSGGTMVIPAPAVGGITKAGQAADETAKNVTKMGRAASAGRTAMAGLGAVTLGIASPMAGVGVLAVGAAAGMYMWANRTRDWDRATANADKSAQQFNQLMPQLGQGYLSLASTSISAEQATRDLAATQKQANLEERTLIRLREQGKKGTKEYTELNQQHQQTLLNLRSARLNDIATQESQQRQYRELKTAIGETVKQAENEVKQRAKAVNTLGQNKVAEDYNRQAAAAKRAGVSVEDYIKSHAQFGHSEDVLLAYGAALKGLEGATGRLGHAQAVASLKSVNLERAMANLAPIASKAAKSFRDVEKLGGKNLQSKISLKFEDPGKAARVAASTAKSLRAGVPKSVATRIVANSASAEQAIKRLQRARLTPKKLEIIESGGKRAVRVLEDIMGRRLTKKEQRIAEQGGKNVLDRLREISGKDLPTKEQEIRQQGAAAVISVLAEIMGIRIPGKTADVKARDGASGIIGQIISLIAGVPTSKTSTITTVYRSIGRPPLSPGPNGERRPNAKGRKGGGYEDAIVGEGSRWQGAREYLVDRKSGNVTRVDQATPVTLAPTTAVIPTEPRYRDRGRSIFKDIARDLGLPRYAKSRKGKKAAPTAVEKASKSDFGKFSGSDFQPGKFLTPAKKFTPAKKRKGKRKFASSRGWANYIEGLQTQQSYWEREVGIRESQVREPENTVVRAPENDYVHEDPVTKEKTKIEAYKANPEIESVYKPALDQVMQAMRTLKEIIAELVRAIPHAVAANRQERSMRGGSIRNLNEQIGDENRRLKGTKDDKKKQRIRNSIDKLKEKRDKHEEENEKLREDEKELYAAREDAGFDFREVTIAEGNTKREYDTASGKADAQAKADTSAQIPSSGSGGGGGSDGSGGGGGDQGGISYGQQQAILAGEKGSVLQAFGSNFAPNGAGSAMGGGAVGGGAGSPFQALLGAVGGGATGSGGVAADLTAGRRATSSSGAAAGAVAGTAGASQAGVAGGAGQTVNEGDKTVIVNNTFATVPPDPHTFAKGVEFEAAAIL